MDIRALRIQYLGCAAFVFEVSNGETIGIDFWNKNTYSYAEDMPGEIGIEDGRSLTKLLISHEHRDHCFIPNQSSVLYGIENEKIIDTQNVLRFPNLSISKYSSEHFLPSWGVDPALNTIFVFDYHGLKICHLADAFGTILDEQRFNDLIRRLNKINILLLPIDRPGFEKIEFNSTLKIIEALCPNVIVPMHYFSLSHKVEFLNDAMKVGYHIVNSEHNLVEIPFENEVARKSKEIWNMKPGTFVSWKTMDSGIKTPFETS